jgi:hypothetical protein
MTGMLEWIIAVAAVLALIVSGAAFFYSRRATLAAEEAAAAAGRAAGVAERQEQRDLEDAHRRAVRWRPERLGSATIKLWNDGEGTAYDVRVEVSEGAQIIGGPQVNGTTINSGEGVRVPASTAGYGHHREFLVHWRASPGSPEESRTLEL